MNTTKNIFTIYAHQDKDVVLYLLLHLQPLEKDFNIAIWQDNPIYPSQPWKPKDASRIDRADIFLLLVSDAFMHSEFIKQDEFKMVIDRYKADKATVIPILVDDCPWEIDFNSDDYDFSFKELQVFPEDRNPIGDWNTTDQVFQNVTEHIKGVITSFSENRNPEKTVKDLKKKTAKTKREDQLAINFAEEREAHKVTDKKEGAKAKKRAEKEKILEESAKAKRMAQEEKRLKNEAETLRKAEEEKRLIEDAESKRRALEEKKRRAQEAEIKRAAAEEKWLGKEVDENSASDEEGHPVNTTATIENGEETQKEKNSNRKKILMGFLAMALLIALIWAFSVFTADTEKKSTALPEIESTEVDSDAVTETTIDSGNKESSFSQLSVGDAYEEGILLKIDPSNKVGQIAYTKDVGPMPWKNAMKIHEQLGEGWRLPTLGELQLMRKTIGQGAKNKGKFADDLYWSATPFDENQARLLRFTDGNTSYHYNSTGTHRKFRVRAIKDFRQ